MAHRVRARATKWLAQRRVSARGVATRSALVVLLVLITAACSQRPVPTALLTATQPTESATPDRDVGARLVVEMGGTIGCATFPYGCSATLSVLPAGTRVADDWRPPASDPWWPPDYSRGTSADRFDANPAGNLPRVPLGRHQLVISLLGSYDTPSFTPDGSVATDLLARCIGEVEIGPGSGAVKARVTFTPDPASFRGSCTVDREFDAD
jgi:hypothetical protein